MKKVYVTTSWDDGHKLDLKLVSLLKKYGIKATFYISPDTNEFPLYDRLTHDQILSISNDFEIGAHTLTHPHLSKLDKVEATREIIESKEKLEGIIGKQISSFCYPYGDYNDTVKKIVKDAGFNYARTINRFAVRSSDAYAANTSSDTYDHIRDGLKAVIKLCGNRPWKVLKMRRWDTLAKLQFERTRETGGVFHLWGHSHEIEDHGDWERLEGLLGWISKQKNVTFVTNANVPIDSPKLLMTAPYFKPHSGGLEEYAYQTAKGLKDDHGWDVAVVTSGSRKRLVQEEYNGIKIYRLPYRFKISNTPFGFRWHSTMKQIISTEQPDIIDAHAPVPGMLDISAKFAKKIPFVVTYHMGTMKKGHRVLDSLILVYEKLALPHVLNKAKGVICSSDFVQQTYLPKYFDKSITVSPGVNSNYFKPIPNKKISHTLLHVGGLKTGEEHKGLVTSIEVVAALKQKYPDVHLNIVGDGDRKYYFEQIAEKLGVSRNIDFSGLLSDDDLVSAYQSADVLIAPSHKESFGMAILEAMACGLPVIAGKVGGIPRLVSEDNSGFMFDPKDINSFASKITEIFDNPDLYNTLSNNARTIAEGEYKWADKVSSTNDFLRKVAGLNIITQKPKLLMATPYFWPKVGGLENYARRTAIEMQKHGWDVVVVTSNHNDGSYKCDVVDGVRVYRLPASIQISNTPIGLLWPSQIRKIIRNENPDLINAHSPVPGIADVAAMTSGKIPFVLTYHAATLYKQSDFVFNSVIFFYRIIEKIMLAKAKVIITVTPYHKDYMSTRTKKKLYLIENAIPESELQDVAHNETSNRLVFINNLTKAHSWKGLDQILNSLSIVNSKASELNIHLDVIGGGDSLNRYIRLVNDLGISNIVKFHGELTGRSKNLILSKAVALVCYPTSAQDAFPTVILEAWAHRVPVIVADIGALTHIIQNGKDGILVDKNDPAKLASKIIAYFEDTDLRKSLAINGFKRAEEQTWEMQGTKSNKLFREYI